MDSMEDKINITKHARKIIIENKKKCEDLPFHETISSNNQSKSCDNQDKHLLPSLEDCLMSEEEISKFSVLDNIDNEAILTEETVSNDKLLKVGANILGGGLITGEELELEGSNPCEVYGVFESILSDIKKSAQNKEFCKTLNSLIDSTHELIEIAKDVTCFSQSPVSESNRTQEEEIKQERIDDQVYIQKLVINYADRIKNLKEDESFNMFGGWRDQKAGHAQIYEIIYQGNDLYALNFYTSTYDPKIGIWKNGTKSKIQPIVRYRNIPREYLLLGDNQNSALFIQNLLELQLSYKSYYNLKINTDVVNSVFFYLLPYHVETSIKESGVVLGQRSGTCVPSVWKVFARMKCKDLNTYKHLMFEVKLSFLTHFFKRLEDDLELNTEDGKNKRRTLKYVTRNFLRSIAKMEGHEELLRKAQASCFDILKRVEKAENNIKKYQKKNALESDLKSETLSSPILKEQKNTAFIRVKKIKTFNKEKIPFVEKPKVRGLPSFLKDPISSSPRFCQGVKNIQRLFWDGTKTSQKTAIKTAPWMSGCLSLPMKEFLPILELEYFIEALPIPSLDGSDFWAKLEKKEALECMKSLESLLYMYNLVDQQPFLRQQTAYITLYAIMHRLASVVESFDSETINPMATITHYKMNNYALELLESEGALFLDFKIFNKLKKVAIYFEEFNDNKCPNEKTFDFDADELSINDKPSSYPFWKALLESNKELKKDVESYVKLINTNYEKPLPFEVAAVLLLESGYFPLNKSKTNLESRKILFKYNLSYIHQFRYACFLANPFVEKKEQSEFGGPYKSCGGLNHNGFAKISNRQCKRVKDIDGSAIEGDEHRDVGNYIQLLQESKFSRYAHKFVSDSQKESDILDASRKENYDKEKTSLLRIAETWELTPDQLLFYFESEVSLLSEPQRQSLFFRLFFRSVVLGEEVESVCLGAGELLCKEKSLRENTLSFIQKGLSYFFESKASESVKGQRFFLELSFYCEKYLKDQGMEKESALFNQINWINERLEEKPCFEDAAIFHRLRLLFYSLQNCENLTSDQLAAIFISHIEVTFHQDTKEWASLFLDDLISNFVSKALSAMKDRRDLDVIGPKILVAFQLIEENVAVSKISENLLYCNDYTIDLKMGKIYSPRHGLISRLSESRMLSNWELFEKKIFANNDKCKINLVACFNPVGKEAFLFKDPLTKGEVLINEKKASQQFEPDGPWYEYKEKLHFCVEPALLKRHNYWWNPKTSEGYLVDKTNNQRKFCVNPEGRIISFENQEIEAGGLSLFKDEKFINLEKAKAFSNFTEGKDVLILSKNEQIQEVHFTNFLSQSGSPLKFIEKHGKMVWSEQEEYFIATQTPQGLLASTSEYLYLESVNSKSIPKILVPYKKMDDAKGRDSFWDIKFCSYFVYDIIEDEVVSTSLESKLHLAHIYAQQKEYGTAMRLLRSIKPVDKFSKRAQEILYSISNMKLQEDHPDLKMVILYAVLVDLRNRQAQAKVPITDYPAFLEKEFVQYRFEFKIGYSFTEKALDYANMRNNISQSCRLTFEEEMEFLTACEDSILNGKMQEVKALKSKGQESETLKLEELIVSFGLRKKSLQMTTKPELEERYSQELVKTERFRGTLPDIVRTYGYSRTSFKEIMKKGVVLNSQLVRSYWTENNAVFFVKVFCIAIKGSENEKKCMLYCLMQWRYLDLLKAKGDLNKTDPWLERMISSIVHSNNKGFFNFFDMSSVEEKGEYLTEKIMNDFDGQYQRYPLTTEKVLNFLTDGEVEKSIQEEFLGNFPINVQPQLYPIESKKPLKKGLGPTEELLPSTDKRWQTTAKWKERFLNETTLSKENEKEEVEEKPFILNAIDELNKELASGEALLDKEPIYSVKENLSYLEEEAIKKKEKLNRPLQDCEEAIKRLANKLPKNEEKRLREMALVGGLVKKVITIEDCLKAVLLFNSEAFKELNSHLKEKDIEKLQKLLLEREQIRSHQAQLSRIILNARNGNLNLLAQNLKAHYHFQNFSLEQQIAFHVYCGETGMIPFDTQMRVIEDMVSLSTKDVELFTHSCIKASTMGSGKSKLIAPIVFFLASMQPGKQPFFIAPDALFEVSKIDLSNIYFKAFKRHVQAVDARRDELTLYKLKKIKMQFDECQSNKQPLIIKSVFVQTIILECRDQALKLAAMIEQNSDRSVIAYHKKRFELLEDLRDILGKRTIPIGDEVDQLMHHNKEVNFPLGEKQKIPPALNRFIYHLYDVMQKSELQKLIKLQKNEQASLSKDDYQKIVVPKLIDALFETKMPLEFVVNRKCCKRFLCNEIPSFVQMLADDPMVEITQKHIKEYEKKEDLQDDIAFLRQLSIDAKGKGTQKEQAELLCKAKELFVEILPIALKKNGNQDYGYAREPNNQGYRKMVPYKGVNEPVSLNTEIGYYMMEVCISYQWALSFNLSKEDVVLSLKELDLAARESVKRYGISYKETPAYKTCKEFFNIELAQKDNPKALEDALDFIKERPEKKLQLMHDRINDTVSYYSEKFSCNGSNMARLFATFLGMSGTPWNAHLLLKRLVYTPDIGSEGKIMQKWRKEKTPVINVKNFISVSSFMEQCCTGEISSIIDTGGFFKNFGSNRKVAEEILDYLKEPIKAVLFFEENELYMWEKGKEPKCLGGTDNIPLDPETYFVYYDHLHITGADIYQKPKAKAVMTFDKHKVTQRDSNQGGKRLRQDSQRLVVACIQEEGEKEWGFDDVLSKAAQTQKEQIQEAALILCKQEIDSLFAHYADEKLAFLSKYSNRMSDKIIAQTIRNFQEFLVIKTEEDFYEQHGRLKGEVDTKEMLQEYLTKKLKAYGKIEKNFQIQKEAKKITVRIENSTVLPKTILTSSNPDREQTVEVDVDTDVNKDQDLNKDTEKEQERELNFYTGIEEFEIKPESEMNEKKLLAIIQGEKLTSIRDQLDKYKYWHPYSKLFNQDICATDNFYYSTKQVLPVFHKMQKPAEEILFFETKEGVKAVFVSEAECRSIKNILKKEHKKKSSLFDHVWLVQPNGTQLIENPHNPFVIEEDAIMPVLIECNVFGGHLSFLAEYTEHTHTYLLDGDEESQKLKLYFLQLRGHQKKAIFKTSLAFKTGQEEKGSSFLLQSSLEYGKNQKGKYKPDSESEAQDCSLNKISQLHVDYVKHLKKPEQLKRLQSWQVPFVEVDCVKNLPFHLVKYLNSKEQMQALTKEQVKHIRVDQAKLIPHIQPDFYGEFDQDWQVQAVPVQHINKISQEHVSKCSQGQLQSITVNQISGLISTPYLFSFIQGDLLHKIPKEFRKLITAKQIEQVTDVKVIEELELQDSSLINACPSQFFTSLSKTQLDELSCSNIQKLTNEQILELTKNNKWSDDLSRSLSKDQIHKFDTQELIDLLSMAQITDHLKVEQLKYLKTENQINACPEKLVTDLSQQQLELLLPENVQKLKNKEIEAIAQANKWSESLSEKLSEQQIQGFDSQELINLLSMQQIKKHITEIQLPFLTTPEQINACPWELITALSQQQLELLLPENVQKLTNEEIEAIAQANKWSESLSEKLSEQQIQGFDSQELINLLSMQQITDHIRGRQQLRYLVRADQINACPTVLRTALSIEQLERLSRANVQNLTQEQIRSIIQAYKWSVSLRDNLSAEQIGGFNTQELIDLLSLSQIRGHITDRQLQYLDTPAQINACPMRLVDSLTSVQVRQLLPGVILDFIRGESWTLELQDLLSREQVIAFAGSADLMPHLTADQINTHLSPNHLTHITEEQIRGLTKKELVLALSDEQIGLLETPEALQAVPLMRVRNFQTKDQFRKRRTIQKIGYAFAIFSMGIISTILLLVGFPTLVVPVALLVGRRRAWKVMTANTSRLTHLFRVGVLNRH